MLSFLYRIYKSKKYIYVYSRNKSISHSNLQLLSLTLPQSSLPHTAVYSFWDQGFYLFWIKLKYPLNFILHSTYKQGTSWEVPEGRCGLLLLWVKTETVKWYADECEWATWKDKGMSALIQPLLWDALPHKVWSFKKIKFKKKGTHKKKFRINMLVSYINFCRPKVQGKGFSAISSWLKECRLLTSYGKDWVPHFC